MRILRRTATVAFVVPEDAAEESFLRVYATAEIVDVSGDAVEGYPEQVKFPYVFSISHQIEVAIDVTGGSHRHFAGPGKNRHQ